MNNLYEFGGACDVIIRCNNERIIGGKTYKANEPYTILKDVFVSLGYKNITSDSGAKKNVIAHREGLPDIININGITLTTKVCDLIAERTREVRYINKVCECIADNGKIYLPETPADKTLFIYKNNELFTTFIIENDILKGEFIEGQSYLIFYSVLSDNICFNFNVPSYGYFSLDIIGKGNVDKITQNVYLNFPAVSLISVPVFDLVNGTILNAPLQFECIHRGQKEAFFAVGD